MADQTARLLRELKNRPGHSSSLACGYGAHDFERDKPYPGYKQCRACNATYVIDLGQLLTQAAVIAAVRDA